MTTPDLESRINRVRDELAAIPKRPEVRKLLRRLDRGTATSPSKRAELRNDVGRRLGHCGAVHHRYRLEPPLPEEQVEAFERRNQIRLPEDYRAFITRIANGGAGPSHYRLLPLNPEYTGPGLLVPFPFRPDTLPLSDWADEMALDEDDGIPFYPGYFWCGAIPLTEEGCTFYQVLVVTGPHRGRIVHLDVDGNDWPTFDPAPDFLTWYENWLFQREDPLPQDHDALARIVLTGEEGAEAENAVRACFRLAAPYPLTQSSAIDVLAEGLYGGAGPVGRARATWVLGEMADRRSELGHVRHLIRPALRDPDPAVRAMAVEYVDMNLIHGMVGDPAPEVVGAALVRLAHSGDHRLEVLRGLLTSPSAAARIAGAEAGRRAYRKDPWRERPDIDVLGNAIGDMFLAAMDDPEPRVRAAAITVLNAREPERARGAFLAASHDPDEQVRFRAVQALFRYAADDAVVRARLRAVADHDESPAIRIETRSRLPHC